MLYKLYSQGSVRSLDDPVTNYQFDFSVKNPFNNAPITLRWVLKLYSFLHITFRSNKPKRNLSKALKVSKVILLILQFSYDLEKYSFRKCSLFVLSVNGWKDPNLASWPLCFPAKENCNIEKALFDWPIVLQYEVKAKYRLNSRKVLGMKFFSPERSFNQRKATLVCTRSINQSNRSISVRLLFLFSSRVFISRTCENRSIVLTLQTACIASFRSTKGGAMFSRYKG